MSYKSIYYNILGIMINFLNTIDSGDHIESVSELV